MKSAILLLAASMILVIPANAQAQRRSPEEVQAFRALNAIEDPAERLGGVEAFLEKYPESGYRINALMLGIRSAAEVNPSSELVLDYTKKYIEVYGERSGPALAYAVAAGILHNADAWPQKVDEYVQKAIAGEGGYGRGTRGEAQAYDVIATINGDRGNIETAIDFEKQAIELNPRSAQYSISLAGFLVKAGDLDEAESILVAALLQNPENQMALDSFEKLASQRVSSQSAVHAYRERVFGIEADKILADADNQLRTKINLVNAFSKLGVLHGRAMEFAADLASETGPEVGADLFKAASIAIAQVQFDMGQYQKVLDILEPATLLASGYDEDFHLLRGQSFEQLGRDREALKVYLEAASAVARPGIMTRLEALWEKVAPDHNLEETLEGLKAELQEWHPDGQYSAAADWSGQVVLSELFTGSECPPCVASDIAFDGLIAYYPHSANIVLVYHEHIPGPDPMTNPDSEARMAFYTRDVVGGTPTAIVNGTESSVGGGGATAAKGRFGLYSWMINQQLPGTPKVDIKLAGSCTGQNVSMLASVDVNDPLLLNEGDLKLRVVLAEEMVHFEGRNGVAEHPMVVRAFIGGHDGFALNQGSKTTEASGSIDVSSLESDLLTYLSDWESENSDRFRDTPGFKEKKHEIDESQLYLIAFVQDDSSKQIFQSIIVDLKRK